MKKLLYSECIFLMQRAEAGEEVGEEDEEEPVPCRQLDE